MIKPLFPFRKLLDIAEEVPKQILSNCFSRLPDKVKISVSGDYEVYLIDPETEADRIMEEIGRLREITFRAEKPGWFTGFNPKKFPSACRGVSF